MESTDRNCPRYSGKEWSDFWKFENTLCAEHSVKTFWLKGQKYTRSAIKEKSGGLKNCVGFIDITGLGISGLKRNMSQRVVYNGHKRKHALTFRALNTPDGLILHLHEPMEGRRHEWTLFVQSGLDEVLSTVLEIAGTRFCVFTDAGYNPRWHLEVLFSRKQSECKSASIQ